MQKKYSYNDCYKALDISHNCSWADLRRAYKKSIHKWHPDRFKDGSQEKSAAEHKIKTINIAYNYIHKYYRENADLPPIVEIKKATVIDDIAKESIKSESSNTQKKVYEGYKSPNRLGIKKSSKPFIYVLILISLLSSYYFFENNFGHEMQHNFGHTSDNMPLNITSSKTPTEETANAKNHLHYSLAQKPLHSNNTSEKKSMHDNASIKRGHFTLDSTISDVIGIQGAPTRSEDNVWFYGASEVHFKEGKVSHWVRSRETPLKARIVFGEQKTIKSIE